MDRIFSLHAIESLAVSITWMLTKKLCIGIHKMCYKIHTKYVLKYLKFMY